VSIEVKKQRLEELKAWLTSVYAEPEHDYNQINAIIAEINQVEAEIADEQEKELLQEEAKKAEQAHIERVVQATDELADVIDNLDVGEGLTLRNYFDSEGDYQLITIAIKQSVSTKLAAFSEVIRGYEEREVSHERQISNLQQALKDANQAKADVQAEASAQVAALNQVIVDKETENAELANKLFQASSDIDKAQTEIESLKAQLAAKNKVNEGTPELSAEERAKRVLEKKAEITVYNVVPDAELNPRNYTAILAATGETIQFTWLQKNRYIVVDESAGLQFRTEFEAATKPVAQVVVPDQPLVTTEPAEIPAVEIPAIEPVSQFPAVEEVPTEVAGTTYINYEVAGQEQGNAGPVDTIETLVQEVEKLKADVANLKRHTNCPY
jgi:hypothetical protein